MDAVTQTLQRLADLPPFLQWSLAAVVFGLGCMNSLVLGLWMNPHSEDALSWRWVQVVLAMSATFVLVGLGGPLVQALLSKA